MDGYAVRAADTRPGATLRVVDRVIAGSLPRHAVGPGEAVRIFTGAPMPDGADAVVPQEDVDASDGIVGLRGGVDPGAYVRPAGWAGEAYRSGGRGRRARVVGRRVGRRAGSRPRGPRQCGGAAASVEGRHAARQADHLRLARQPAGLRPARESRLGDGDLRAL